MEFVIISLVALVIGSFLNVVIYRLPLMILQPTSRTFNLALPASHCPHCQTPLRFWHNIPVISYLFLRGRCHACQNTISWRYPLVEILCLILSLVIYLHVGLSVILWPALLLTYALVALTFIDIDEHILPDCITLPLIAAGLLFNSFDLFVLAPAAIWGALLGFILLWSVDRIYGMIRKHPGIGMGDCKLLAALGAWLGVQALIPIILIASIFGLCVAMLFIMTKRLKYDSPLAFGPFLALSAWVYLLKVI